MKTPEHQELLDQYRLLSKRVVEDNGDIITIHQKDRVINYKYANAIKEMTKYVNHKLGRTTDNTAIKDIFKGFAPKQSKKVWKGLGCSMTMEEIEQIDNIMKKHGIKTHNQFIRLVLLKVIEANK